MFTFFTLLLLTFHPTNISEEITIKFEGNKIDSIQRSELALPSFDDSMIDLEKYNQLVESIEQKFYVDPIDATLDKNGKLISERNGRKLNRQKFKEVFYTYFYSNGSATITIPTQTVYPKVDSELLSSIKSKKVSQYVTYFNSMNKERSKNIHLASEAINNYVLFPKERFSFNAVVGQRTKDRGYLPAPIIVRGELAEGVGGGICQVSSTLFNAVDLAGVKITERYSHSRKVPYVPPKRDATVSWFGPDFAFENVLNQPILIRSKVVGSRLIIEIFSSETLEPNADTSEPYRQTSVN